MDVRSFLNTGKKTIASQPSRKAESLEQKRISLQAKSNIAPVRSESMKSLPAKVYHLREKKTKTRRVPSESCAMDAKIAADQEKKLSIRQDQLESIQEVLILLKSCQGKLDCTREEHQLYAKELNQLGLKIIDRRNQLKILIKDTDLDDDASYDILQAQMSKLETINFSLQIDKLIEDNIAQLTNAVIKIGRKIEVLIYNGEELYQERDMLESSISQVIILRDVRSKLPSMQDKISNEKEGGKILKKVYNAIETSAHINDYLEQKLQRY